MLVSAIRMLLLQPMSHSEFLSENNCFGYRTTLAYTDTSSNQRTELPLD